MSQVGYLQVVGKCCVVSGASANTPRLTLGVPGCV